MSDRQRNEDNGGQYNTDPGYNNQQQYYGDPRYNGGQQQYYGDPRYNGGQQQYYGDPRYNGGQQQYYGDPRYNDRQQYYGDPRYNGQQQYYDGRPAKRKKKKGRRIRFVIELIILFLLAIGLFAFVKLGRMGHLNLKDVLVNDGITSGGNFQNIVIYGVDSREGELTKDSHSDTIVICSINKRTKEVKMVSVYRDTYLDNTNGEFRKATECYYFGGPERSINMLNKNLDLDIKDYVAVNFNAVVKAVDLIGGIDLDITEEELQWLNGYQVENSEVTGTQIEPLTSAGYQHLNGNQTLAYCRIRYTEGYDFRRTERQRTVLMKIFEKARSQGVPTMLSLVNTMLPSISTSLNTAELIALVTGMGSYSLGESTGFPFDQYPINDPYAGDCVVPVNLANNVTRLHAFLFGQEGYIPSQTVQEISNQIINNTGVQ